MAIEVTEPYSDLPRLLDKARETCYMEPGLTHRRVWSIFRLESQGSSFGGLSLPEIPGSRLVHKNHASDKEAVQNEDAHVIVYRSNHDRRHHRKPSL
jgi:hypothetical protein